MKLPCGFPRRTKTLLYALIAFAAFPPGLFGADFSVPRLEFASRGFDAGGKFAFSSSAQADFAVDGGYKYGILLGLGLEIPNLEKALSYGRLDFFSGAPGAGEYNEIVDRLNNQAVLSFRLFEARARELFGSPLDLSFFAGHYRNLGAGDGFADLGEDPPGTSYQGFFYFPEGIGGDPSRRYDGGIHRVFGTGFAASLRLSDILIPGIFLYQDMSYHRNSDYRDSAPGFFTGDLTLLLNTEKIQAEFFAGVSYLQKYRPALHGGIMAFFSSGTGFDFLFQAGLPYWSIGGELTLNHFYFLLEPRLRFGGTSLHLTFFFHPLYYQNVKTGSEQGKADVNAKLFFGGIQAGSPEWGLEATMRAAIQKEKNFELWLSPFAGVLIDSLRWDFKLRLNPLYFFEGGTLIEAFIGIRTAY